MDFIPENHVYNKSCILSRLQKTEEKKNHFNRLKQELIFLKAEEIKPELIKGTSKTTAQMMVTNFASVNIAIWKLPSQKLLP